MPHATPKPSKADEEKDEVREAFERRYGELVRHVASHAPMETLAEALAQGDPYSGLAGVLRVAVSLEPVADPLAAAKARSVEARRRLLERAGGALRVGEVAELLGVTTQAVQARRSRGTILSLALPRGEHVYPAVQFHEGGLLEGLREVLGAFEEVDPWTQLAVLLAPSERFGGKSGFDLLRAGEVDGALSIAATYGEHLA